MANPTNLYKRSDSPYWWFSYQYNGDKHNKSTKTVDVDEAIRIRDQWIAELGPVAWQIHDKGRHLRTNRQWSTYLKRVSARKNGWIDQILAKTKYRAKHYKIEHSLTKDELISILWRSRGRCEVSFIPFSDDVYDGKRQKPFFPSIDRIDSSKGYVFKNCRVVCSAVNLAMNTWGDVIVRAIQEAYAAKLKGESVAGIFMKEP